MEGRIIQSLNFNLAYTTTLNLLEAMINKRQKESNFKKMMVLMKKALKYLHMCKFLLELSEDFTKISTLQLLSSPQLHHRINF